MIVYILFHFCHPHQIIYSYQMSESGLVWISVDPGAPALIRPGREKDPVWRNEAGVNFVLAKTVDS